MFEQFLSKTTLDPTNVHFMDKKRVKKKYIFFEISTEESRS